MIFIKKYKNKSQYRQFFSAYYVQIFIKFKSLKNVGLFGISIVLHQDSGDFERVKGEQIHNPTEHIPLDSFVQKKASTARFVSRQKTSMLLRLLSSSTK